MRKTNRIKTPILLVVLVLGISASAPTPAQYTAIPLQSWTEGPVKKAILDFVTRVTRQDGPDFIPLRDRVAVFDNDGTLWPEQPIVQVAFMQAKIKEMAAQDPSLYEKQPYKAALNGDLAYLMQAGAPAMMELLAATEANMSDEQFTASVKTFFKSARHPKLGVPYAQTAYQPMLEVFDYLRANGFQIWICTGGGIDFLRVISWDAYQVPPERVIGSSIQKEFVEKDGKSVLWRKAQIQSINDKNEKPVNISLHIGQRPVFTAGNVRSGGDIAMLEYSQGRAGPSFQLVINHDDAEREFAYREKDTSTLTAAKTHNWNVVSMKNDWKTVFAQHGAAQKKAQ